MVDERGLPDPGPRNDCDERRVGEKLSRVDGQGGEGKKKK
jgi:hypothetical protein